jgi:hypothetical protein
MPQPREAPKPQSPGWWRQASRRPSVFWGGPLLRDCGEVTRVDGESGEILGTLSGIAPDPGACVTKELRLCL